MLRMIERKRIQTCTALAEGKVQVRAKRDSEGVRKNKDGGEGSWDRDEVEIVSGTGRDRAGQ